MKYLLDQEDMDNLTHVVNVDNRNIALNEARKELLRLSSFVCIHDKSGNHYCDSCPCSSIGKDRETWNLICGKDKRYSK